MPTFLPTVADMMANSVSSATPHGFLKGTTGMGPPYGATSIATYVRDLQAVGATINRSYISWDVANPAPGVYVWNDVNKNVDLWYTSMVNAGITPILHHIFAPQWWLLHNGWSPSSLPYADWPPYPSADWDFFMTQNVTAAQVAAARFPLAIIEPCNEWNNGSIYAHPGGTTLAVTAANYAAYFAPIQAAYKSVNPTQKCIIGGLLRMDSANFSNWVAGNAIPALLKPALDALSCTPDGVSIHPYMLGAPTSNPVFDIGPNILSRNSWQSVGRYLDAQDAAGWHLPVYITETGFRASGTNGQNAFNCNSEDAKAIWNRYEHDNVLALYTKDARPAGKSWVEAMMYYRWQEYPAPTATSKSGGYPGDPPEGPHPLNLWGQSLQDFIARINQKNAIQRLDGLTLTCPSTAVVGQPAVSITAAGVGTGCVPNFHSSDSTVVLVGAQTTGVPGVNLTFPNPGVATVWVDSYSAWRNPVAARVQITVAGQVPTASTVSPVTGWSVASSTGGTLQFTVVVLDQIGNPITSPTGTWSSSDAPNAPVDPITGLLTAVAPSAGVVVTFTPTGFAGAAGTSTGDVVLNPVLQITSGPVTLINVGASAVTVTDGTNPITGCTLVISDASKATASGQTVIAKVAATSGTYTVKAQKAGYADSTTVTFTCSGGGILDDKDAIGLSNGASVTTYTDPDGNTWAEPTNAPTYVTNDLNGHASLAFNGTSSRLRAAAAVAKFNGLSMTYGCLVLPLAAAPAANELFIDNRDTTDTQGWLSGRNATNANPLLFYYTSTGAITQQFDGSAIVSGSWTRVIDRLAQGAQSRMTNGAVNGSVRTDPTYRNATTAPPRPYKGMGIFTSNFFQGRMALEILVDHAVTDTERLQIDLYMQTYGAL